MTKTDPILRCVDDTGAEGEYYALDRSKWREVRKVQGKDKGKPYTVPDNGVIKFPSFCVGKRLRIFVEDINDNSTDPEIPE